MVGKENAGRAAGATMGGGIPPGSGAAAAAVVGAGAGWIADPQLWQKREPEGTDAPQLLQNGIAPLSRAR